MFRILGLLVCVMGSAAAVSDTAQQPWISIIIDDLGNDAAAGAEAVRLPGQVTLSLLPHTAHSRSLAQQGLAELKELMLHLPMESNHGRELGPGGLTQHMTGVELAQTMVSNLEAVPGVAGINNHMGSLLTQHPDAMRSLMAWIRAQGGLYFVDSRTDKATVAESTARALGVPVIRRDIFLDNHRDPVYIEEKFHELLRLARRQGSAVAIGHPYPETLQVLRQELEELDRHGVKLVPVSWLIERRKATDTGSPTWHAYSSPSLQDSKN